jgi:integrase
VSDKRLPKGIDRPRPGVLRARYRDASGRQRSRQFPERPRPGEVGGIRAAERWRREQMAAVETGTHVHDDGLTFGEYAVERMAAWRRHRDSTRAQVAAHMRNHVLPTFGHIPLGSIRTGHIEAWVTTKSEDLAPSTLAVVHTWLSRVLADAERAHLIRENPASGVELPPRPDREVVPLSLDAVDAVADAMPEPLRAAVLVAAWAGLRQGEVLGLRPMRLSLLGRRVDGRIEPPSIRVAEQLQTPAKGAPALVPLKTKRSVRRVPIPGVLVDALAAHLAAYPAEADDLLFRNSRTGTPLRRNHFGGIWAKAVAEAGLPKGTHYHDLRHSYASLLIEAGESVTVVSKRLGHATAVETLNTYSHLWPDNEGRTVEVLNAAAARHASKSVSGVSEAGL